MNFLHIVSIIGGVAFLLTALFNIGLWACGAFKLPRYVHWIAAAAFLLGVLLGYEIVLLGNSLVSTLWFPFAFAALVYFLFTVHGVGMPSSRELKQATAEWKTAADEQEGTVEDGEKDEEWQKPTAR